MKDQDQHNSATSTNRIHSILVKGGPPCQWWWGGCVAADMSVGRIWIDSIFIGGGHKRGEATAIEGRRAYSPCVGGLPAPIGPM